MGVTGFRVFGFRVWGLGLGVTYLLINSHGPPCQLYMEPER